MEVKGTVYIDPNGKSMLTVREIFKIIQMESENDEVFIDFNGKQKNVDNPYLRNAIAVDFSFFIYENELYDPDDMDEIKSYISHAFDWYFEDKDIIPIMVKNLKKVNDYDWRNSQPVAPAKVNKKAVKPTPPKEYTTKKSKTRTVFVLKENIL